MHNTGSRPQDDPPWYCWEGQIDGKPTTETFNTLPDYQIGERNTNGTFFVVKDHWVVDNRDGLLTSHLHSKGVNHVTGKKAYLVPVAIEDNSPATGVDAVSTTALPTDIGYQEDFWIMAPCGGQAYNNDMRFRIPLTPAADLKIEAANASPSPDTTSLSNANPGPIVTWSGNGAESIDDTSIWKIGPTQEPVELPIRVKTMKKRTVKVHVYQVAKEIPGGNPVMPDPLMVPSEEELENHLNPLFAYQMNTWFDVDFHGSVKIVNWGEDFEYSTTGDHSEDQTLIVNEFGGLDADSDIHVFIIGKHSLLGSGAAGVTSRNMASCWIAGKSFMAYNDKQEVMETIGHEVGHVFFGDGHPNELDVGIRGVAPLAGTDRTKRLMCKGALFNADSRLIVKKEWDAAEEWLKKTVDDPNQ